MPRFYFNVIDSDPIHDTDGTDLPDLAAARHAASNILAEQLRNSRDEFWEMKRWLLEITDQGGIVLAALCVTAESVNENVSEAQARTSV